MSLKSLRFCVGLTESPPSGARARKWCTWRIGAQKNKKLRIKRACNALLRTSNRSREWMTKHVKAMWHWSLVKMGFEWLYIGIMWKETWVQRIVSWFMIRDEECMTRYVWKVAMGGWRWIVIMREHRSQVLQSVPSLASAHKVSTLGEEFACKGTSEELNGFRRVTLAKSEEGDHHSGWRDSISWSNVSNLSLLSVSIQCDDTVFFCLWMISRLGGEERSS